MPSAIASPIPAASEPGGGAAQRLAIVAAAAVVGLTGFRLALALLDRTELSTDEAQYWVWGQNLDFGAYSKPPLIGWIIRASTELFGTSVAAVRLPAALIHGVTALVLFDAARRMLPGPVALLTALSYLTAPAVALGSALMTTDTPLLLAAAVALRAQIALAEARTTAQPAAGWAVLFGLGLGVGLLAKHAMLFWMAGALAAALVSPAFRPRARDALLAVGVLAAVAMPHLAWLARHDFVTLAHVRDITQGGALSGLRPLRFLGEQGLVMGPVLFAGLVLSLASAAGDERKRGLAALALAPLLIVTAQAVRGPVLANWAVLALLPGTALAAAWLVRRRRLWRLSLALGLAVSLALPVVKVLGTGLQRPDGQPLLARYLGHGATAHWALGAARAAGAAMLVAQDRALLADLAWFGAGRAQGPALRALPPAGRPQHHWEATAAFSPTADAGPVLLIWPEGRPRPCPDAAPVGRFEAPPGAYGGTAFGLWRLDCPACLAGRGGANA